MKICHKVRISETMKVGCIVKHPDGRMVYVTGGCYLDPTYGRVSNFWYWNEVLSNGTLSEKDERGYGWAN